MKYIVQNTQGRIYGIFSMPRSNQSLEVWTMELREAFTDVLDQAEVHDISFGDKDGQRNMDCLVIDVPPSLQQEEQLQLISSTIVELAQKHSGELPT